MKQEHTFHGVWISAEPVSYGEEDAHYYQDHPNAVLHKEFEVKEKKQVLCYIACLGYYIVYINGKRVGEDELNHDWTNPKACVYYEQYDITSYVSVGKNNMEIHLGNGMYNPAPLRLFGKYNLRERLQEIGEPQLLCDIIMGQAVLAKSDDSWRYEEGSYVFQNLYLGERIDFTKDRTPSRRVVCLQHERCLKQSFMPKNKVFQTVEAKERKPFQQGILVDFHEMISGFIDVTLMLKQGQRVTIQYSERLQGEHLDFSTSFAGSVGEVIQGHVIDGGKGAPAEAIQTDVIIGTEGKHQFRNQFTWHSFRYAYITGCELEQLHHIRAHYVHANLQQIGHVHTTHAMLQELYDVAIRTKLNNAHATFEDCARERLGYGGDMVALAMSNLYTFDLEAYYRKILLDFRYDQSELGGISETAPYVGIQSNGTGEKEGPLLWQLVYPYLLYKHNQFYGDREFLKEEYPYVVKQLNYLMSFDLDQLAACCLGDHGSMLLAGQFRVPTPDKAFVGYCSVLLLLKYGIALSNLLHEDCKSYQASYSHIENVIKQKFLREDGSYGDKTQTSYAFAIALELGDCERLCEQLATLIKENQYVLDSGIFGMAFTYEALHTYGYDDVVEAWLLQESAVSFHHMLSSGSRALSELFVGEHQSYNHAMFASYQQWYYEGLAGIQIQEDACAFSHIKLRPYFSKKIKQVDARIQTKQGELRSTWFKEQKKVIWKVHIPKGIQYEILNQPSWTLLHQECHEEDLTFLYQPA